MRMTRRNGRGSWHPGLLEAALLPALAMVLISAPAAAQTGEAPEPPDYLSVNDRGEIELTPLGAARWALERNTGLRIQSQAVAEARGRVGEAGAADEFTLSASGLAMWMGPVSSFELPGAGGDGDGNGGDGPGEAMAVQIGQDHLYKATISAAKPLYTAGRVGLAVDLAEEGVSAAERGTEAARLGVWLGAQEAGYGVLRAVQLSGVAAARVTAIAEHVRNAEVMEDTGVVPHFDVVQARTELARAQGDLISAQSAVEQAKAGLRNVLALPQSTSIALMDGPAPEMPEGELPDLIDRALANRPEIAACESAVRIARLNVELNRREHWPTIALTGEYSRQSAGGLGGTAESWQIGVVAEKPILDGGAKAARVESAHAHLRSAELELQRTREQAALEVVQSFLAVQEAAERIETAQQGVVEARERRRMAQIRYREGIAAGIEVIDADTALAAAEASLVNAEYDHQLAVTRLRAAMGVMAPPPQEGETQ